MTHWGPASFNFHFSFSITEQSLFEGGYSQQDTK
jgi:hypothetical protein